MKPSKLNIKGKKVTTDDLTFINRLINNYPKASRRQLSRLICEAWNPLQADGHLKDMVCQGLLLPLERSDYLQLSPVKFRPTNPLAHRNKPAYIAIDTTLIYDHGQIAIKQMRRMPDDAFDDSLISEYHYSGHI